MNMMICPLKGRNITVSNIAGGEQEIKFLNTFITQSFGETQFSKTGVYGFYNGKPRPHNGVDFRATLGTIVFAPFDGVVTAVTSTTGYGNHIRIKNENWECVLAHLSSITVKDGATVKIGDPIGKTGSSGNSTAPHLHFGVRPIKNGSVLNYDENYYGYINPLPLLLEWYGTISNQINFSGLTDTEFTRIINRL